MRKIRNGIFETNSSSTHALATIKENNYVIPEKLKFDLEEFGWEYRVLYDTHDKASYIMTLIYSAGKAQTKEWLDKLSKILEKNNIQYSYPEIKWNQEYDRWDMDYGYIDHSYEAFDWLNELLNDSDKLFRFLFDKKSFISTGNDNSNGYYLPGIGCQDDYYNENYDTPLWDRKVKELENDFDIFWKGN